MILRDPHWTDNLSEIVTDKSWSLPRGLVLSGLIYLFTVYTDQSYSYYGNRSQPENILISPKINFVNWLMTCHKVILWHLNFYPNMIIGHLLG